VDGLEARLMEMRAGRDGVHCVAKGRRRACRRWPSSQASEAVKEVRVKPSPPASAAMSSLSCAGVSASGQPLLMNVHETLNKGNAGEVRT